MIEHLRGREQALGPLGWTGWEAEWIALVCLHSGVFTRAQFCHYFNTQRMTALRFVKALIEQRAAVETDVIAFNGGGKTCRISGKGGEPGGRGGPGGEPGGRGGPSSPLAFMFFSSDISITH